MFAGYLSGDGNAESILLSEGKVEKTLSPPDNDCRRRQVMAGDGDRWQVMAGDRRRWMAGAGAGWQGMAGEGRRYGRRWMQVMAGDGR